MAKVDVGQLTAEETFALAVECLENLSENQAIRAVMEGLHQDTLEELKATLDGEPEEGDDE